MLDKVKNHIFGYSAILIVSTGAIVSSVVYFLVIQNLERDITFLAAQNSSFQQQITTLQSTLASINQANDKRTTERVSEYKEIFTIKENILNSRISELEKSIASCKITGDIVSKTSKETCDGYNEMVSYISYVKKQEVSVSNDLSKLHNKLYEMKGKYQFDQAECDKNGSSSGNICEIASLKKGQVEALESEIETKRVYLAQLSEQLLKLNDSR